MQSRSWEQLRDNWQINGNNFDPSHNGSQRDFPSGSVHIGFSNGFNTFGRRQDPNPLNGIRRNWGSPPRERPLLQEALPAQAPGLEMRHLPRAVSPPRMAKVLDPMVVKEARVVPPASQQPVRPLAATPRTLSPPQRTLVSGPAVPSIVPLAVSPALASRAPPPVEPWPLPPPPANLVLSPASALEGAAGHLRVTVPHPLDALKLGITVKHLIVTNITDARALKFGWAIGDQLLKVNGIPVASTRALTAATADALDAYCSSGQPLIFDIWRPPGGMISPPAPAGGMISLPASGQYPPGTPLPDLLTLPLSSPCSASSPTGAYRSLGPLPGGYPTPVERLVRPSTPKAMELNSSAGATNGTLQHSAVGPGAAQVPVHSSFASAVDPLELAVQASCAASGNVQVLSAPGSCMSPPGPAALASGPSFPTSGSVKLPAAHNVYGAQGLGGLGAGVHGSLGAASHSDPAAVLGSHGPGGHFPYHHSDGGSAARRSSRRRLVC